MYKLLFSLTLLSIINSSLIAQNCSINAGLNTTICLSAPMNLYGTRSGLFSSNSFCRWTQISGPAATIVQPDSLVTSVINYTSGTYVFSLYNKCQDGIISRDTVSIVVLPLTMASIGADTAVLCPNSVYHLTGNNTLLPNETGKWIIITNSIGISIDSPENPNSTVTLSPNFSTVTKLRWTITNTNGCSSFDDITIVNCGGVSLVDAGSDQTLDNCYSTTTCTKLVAANGGIGLGGQLGTWSFISGPNIPDIGQICSPTTIVCNLSQGTYIFRYTVVGPCATGTDDVKITVPAPSQNIPSANANVLEMNTAICGNINTITLTGNNPSYAGEIVQWTQTSGPVIVNIHTPNNPSTFVSGLTVPGIYSFNYNITNSNSGCSGNSNIRFVVYDAGTVDGGSDQILPCNITEATIPSVTSGYGVLLYRIVNGPVGVFNYPTTFQSQNKFKGLIYPGTYRVEISYRFGAGCDAVSDFVDITVSQPPTGSNAGSYQSFACNSTYTQLAGNNPLLTGLGNGRWSEVSGPNSAFLVNPTNYICDVKQIISGIYIFRWTINGGNNCPDNHDDITVIIPDSSVTKANAGSDRVLCYNSPVSLQGNSFRADETGHWTAIPADVSFFPSNQIASPMISGLAANTNYTFIYIIRNSCGNYSVDTVKITTGTNFGPSIANAGFDQCLPLNTDSIQLNAHMPNSGSGNWTQIAGPISTIINPFQNNTLVTGATTGNYKFVWTVSVNGCSNITKDTVNVTVSGNTTVANAGVDVASCTHSQVLTGNTPNFGTGHWSQISGDGNAVINDPNRSCINVTSLSTGLYTFRWTISNGACLSNYDDVNINISTPPSVASAGPDQSICGNAALVPLHANVPSSGTGQWVWVTGPITNPIINNSTSPNATIPTLTSGSHVFRWIVSGGPSCPQSTDDVVINVSVSADAGTDKSLCDLTAISLKGNAGSTGIWSQISGPVVDIIQTPVQNPIANVSGLIPNASYTFRYTIPAFSGCPSSFDDIIINNNSPTLISNAGVDDTYCNVTSFTLNGSIPGPGEKGTWKILSGQTGATFLPNENTPHATLTGTVPGIYILTWIISNSACFNADIKRIDNYVSPTIANAGADDTVCSVNNISLNANFPVSGIGKWSQISGPNQLVFSAPNNPKSQVTGLVPGTYRFLWTISNYSCDASSDEVSITILKNPDLADAGTDQNICANTTILKGNTPTGTNKGLWSQISGPDSAVFSSSASSAIKLNHLVAGVYKFVWKIYNERCFNTDTVDIIVNPFVMVNAGNDFSVCNKIPAVSLTGASVSGYTTIGSWSIISGEGILNSILPTNNPSDVMFTPSSDYSGPVVLRLSASDNCRTVTDDITIFVNSPLLYMEAVNDTTRTDPNIPVTIDILGNDKTLGEDTLKLCNNSIITRPVHGTAMINGDGTISYKPVTGYLGIDSFNYKLCNIMNINSTLIADCYTEGNDNAWVYITVEGCIVPNSFSPDGDGVNDFFEIPCAQETVQFNVFNRWGIEVYKNNSYRNDWDGTYDGAPLPEGTYFYMLKYSSDNENKLSKEGFITIRR